MNERAYLELVVNMIKDEFEQTNKNEITISKGEFELLAQNLQSHVQSKKKIEKLIDRPSATESQRKNDFMCCECKEPTKIYHPKQHMMSNQLVIHTRCINCLIDVLAQDAYDSSQQAITALNFIKEKGHSEQYEYFRVEWE